MDARSQASPSIALPKSNSAEKEARVQPIACKPRKPDPPLAGLVSGYLAPWMKRPSKWVKQGHKSMEEALKYKTVITPMRSRVMISFTVPFQGNVGLKPQIRTVCAAAIPVHNPGPSFPSKVLERAAADGRVVLM
jgi:hypothetical protein